MGQGWDGGHSDKCCSSGPGNCLWYGTEKKCAAALAAGVACDPCANCSSGGPTDVTCPQWSGCGTADTIPFTTTAGSMGSNTSVLLSVDGNSAAANRSLTLPAVLRNNIGVGTFLTVLVEDAATLQDY